MLRNLISFCVVFVLLCCKYSLAEENIAKGLSNEDSTSVTMHKIFEGSDEATLWSECRPFVFQLSDPKQHRTTKKIAKNIRKLHSNLENMVELRLRAARLLRDGEQSDSRENLQINLRLSGGYFFIVLEYRRLLDTGYGEKRQVTIWSSEQDGFENAEGTYISSALSEEIDSFIQKFLNVNQAACGK